MAEFDTTEFLAHHGIKGQKWGVRRFQNPDGTRTEAGKKRYSSGEGTEKKGVQLSDNAKKAIKIGAAVAGTALVAYGAYKLGQRVDSDMMKIAIEAGKGEITRMLTYATKKKSISDLADDELNRRIDRLRREQELRKLEGFDPADRLARLKTIREYETLSKERLHPGATYAKNILKTSGSRALSTIGAGAMLYGAKSILQNQFDKKEFANAVFNGGPKKK